MRLLKIFILLLSVKLLLPAVAIQCMESCSDDFVCTFIEDFNSEGEEDDETSKVLQPSFYFRDCQEATFIAIFGADLSSKTYAENNAQLRIIHLKVHTPPPKS